MEVKRKRVVRNKRKTALRLFTLFLIFSLIVGGVVAVVFLLRRDPIAQAQLNTLLFTADDQYVYTGSGFLYIHDENLHNEDLYNSDLNYSVPIDTSNTAFQLAGSSNMQLFYNTGAIKIVGQDFPEEFADILHIECSNSYIAALRSDAASGVESIRVLDNTGKTHMEVDDGNYITDYGFYGANSEYLFVSSMSVSSSTPLTTITIYNIANKSMAAVKQVQSQLIEQMYFTRLSMFAVGTNHIMRYAISDNRESYREMVYGWKVMDFDETTCTFLLRPRSGETLGTAKLMVLNDDSFSKKTERLIQLPAGVIGAFLMNNKLIAISSGGYRHYDMGGRLVKEYRFATNVEEATKLDGSYLLLRAGETMYTLKVG